MRTATLKLIERLGQKGDVLPIDVIDALDRDLDSLHAMLEFAVTHWVLKQWSGRHAAAKKVDAATPAQE